MLFCLDALQTSAALKLVVSPNYLDKDLTRELFVAGYVAGSTRGSAATVLAFMLTQLPLEPWDVPEVRAFMLSVARLKVTFEVPLTRLASGLVLWRIYASPWRQRIVASPWRQQSDPSRMPRQQ